MASQQILYKTVSSESDWSETSKEWKMVIPRFTGGNCGALGRAESPGDLWPRGANILASSSARNATEQSHTSKNIGKVLGNSPRCGNPQSSDGSNSGINFASVASRLWVLSLLPLELAAHQSIWWRTHRSSRGHRHQGTRWMRAYETGSPSISGLFSSLYRDGWLLQAASCSLWASSPKLSYT